MVTTDDGQVQVDPRRLQIVSAVLVLCAIAVAVWLVPPLFADDAPPVAASARPSELLTAGPSPSPSATPTSVTAVPATATPTAEPTVTVEPTVTAEPTATATATEGGSATTVLFGGGPARGPWQQLGTVAEITHPGAPQSARYSYTNFWTDPDEENLPDSLWDRLVTEIAEQLIELGTPVDRPAFGAAEGSEPFNSFGGLQDIYFDDEVFTASWSAVFEDDQGVGTAYYAFLLSFENDTIDTMAPLIYRADGQRTFRENSEESYAAIREWAAERGYTGCESCS